MFQPRGRAALAWRLAVGVLLLLAAVARALLGPVDLFVFPVLVACFVLRRDGLAVLPLALVFYHLSTLVRNDRPLRLVLVSDVIQFAEWSLLAIFVLVTLDKYTAVRRLESRIHQDLDLARTLQAALTVPEYDFGGVRIQGVIQQSNQVGGDFYYFRPFQKKYVVFCLGDVMGKGISASLIMAMVMGFMFEWGKKSPSPEFILQKLNGRLNRLFGEDSSWFITIVYGVFNEETGELVYASGGGQAGLVLRADGSVDQLVSDGIPLGVFPDTEYQESRLSLGPGDRVVLFTDGVTEARAPKGALFGLERLSQLLREGRELPVEQLVESIRRAVRRHTEGESSDDMALLVAEVKPDWHPAPGES